MTSTTASVPLPEEADFKTGQVLTIVGGHFTHDLYTAFVAPLLPLIIEKLSLSLTLAGTLITFMQLPSLFNPLIGYLDDRVNLRFFVILAPAATATLISSMGLAPNYFTLALLLTITGLSIAAFHAPAPAMVARVSGKQVGKGMSLFMAAGELGRTIGPLFAVWAVSLWALDGIYPLAILGWTASLMLYLRFRHIPARTARKSGLLAVLPAARRLFVPLMALVIVRSFVLASMGTFLPTYLNQKGASLLVAGGALSTFELAGVFGALAGGTLSDRLGRKPVLLVAMLSAALLLLTFLQVQGWLLVPILIALGLTSLSAQPVLLAIVQDHLPDHRSAANGAYLAMSFLVRSLATVAIGALGDRLGLQAAFFWSAMVGLLSVPFVLTLPPDPQRVPARTAGTP